MNKKWGIFKGVIVLARKLLLFPHKEFVFFFTFVPLYEMTKISILLQKLKTNSLFTHKLISSLSHSRTHLTLHFPHTIVLGNSSSSIFCSWVTHLPPSFFLLVLFLFFIQPLRLSSAMKDENNN